MIRLIPRITALLCAVVLFFAIGCKKITTEMVPASTEAVTKDTATAVVKAAIVTQSTAVQSLKTKNVIIIVVDGPRFSETWGDSTHQYIPNRYSLRSQGVLLTNFKNNGVTLTNSGHTAIMTGNYEMIENAGNQYPTYPSMFQAFLKSTDLPNEKAWVVTSKEKLNILANCKQPGWVNNYMPKTDCGPGYRADDITYNNAISVMRQQHPNLMLINLKDPDIHGHDNNWNAYINGIKTTDAQIKGIYDAVQADALYQDKTTIIVTNDHGRHLNGIADGFISHGCDCEGCRHIAFFAIGPDFKKGVSLNTSYEQIDISQTVAKLLNFKMDFSKGQVMTALFK